MNKIYYCYILCDPRKPGDYQYVCDTLTLNLSYEPFYVGKGKGKRYTKHVSAALKAGGNACNKHKVRKIRKIITEGHAVIHVVSKNRVSEHRAFQAEQELIAAIGRYDQHNGPLTNLTDGGEFAFGISDKVRKKLSKKTKARFASMSVEERAKFAEAVSKASSRVWDAKSSAERNLWGANISKGILGRSKKAKAMSARRKSASLTGARSAESEEKRQARIAAFRRTMAAKPKEWHEQRRINMAAGHANMSPVAKKTRSDRASAAWDRRKE